MSQTTSHEDSHGEGGRLESISLPSTVERDVITQFDRLLAAGEIFWAPYESETVQRDGINVVFQLSPHLMKKPILDKNDETRKTGKGKNPFLPPEPSFVICQVGPSHTLILNKFCVYRPSLILHTKHFEPQENALNRSDLHAAWALLLHLKQDFMMIYNCGFDSGSSQGHKHMQLWPTPDKAEIGFDLFPNSVNSEVEIATDLPGTPIRHFALKLPNGATGADIFTTYQKLLVEIEKCHRKFGSTSHNVAMTRDWMCLIPRRSSGLEKGAGSNTAGVLGLLWLTSEEEKEIWTKPTIASHLSYIGVPLDKWA